MVSYLTHDPNNQGLLLEAFDLALALGQGATAQGYAQTALMNLPADLYWQLRLANSYLAQAQWETAQTLLVDVLAQTPFDPAIARVAETNLGYIAFEQKQYTHCVDVLRSYLQDTQNLTDISLFTQKIWLRALHRTQAFDLALSWVQALAAQAPLNPSLAGIAALIALDSNNLSLAKIWLAQAQGEGLPIEAHVAQAAIHLIERNAPAARQSAQAALHLNPQEGRAWSLVGFSYLAQSALDLARQHFEQAIQHLTAHIGTWHGLGWTALMQGDLALAKQSFEAALALNRNFAESHGALAVVLALQKQVTSAEAEIERALRLDKQNLSGRYAQAILSGQAGDAVYLQKLARRLLENRTGPGGVPMVEWL